MGGLLIVFVLLLPLLLVAAVFAYVREGTRLHRGSRWYGYYLSRQRYYRRRRRRRFEGSYEDTYGDSSHTSSDLRPGQQLDRP